MSDNQSLGFDERFEQHLEAARESLNDPHLEPARVAVEHRGVYQLFHGGEEAWAELTGRLRHQALDRLELPAVGDWVAVRRDGRIEALLPRRSAFVRKAAGNRTEPQVIAANIDFAFVVTSPNQEFNPRRIERYLAAIREGGATAVLVMNKMDLCGDVSSHLAALGKAASGLDVVRISALSKTGRGELEPFVGPGKTVALVGSSGVGKSTLANWLLGEALLDTGDIRRHDAHGRHTTTHRELLPLPGGGALIDTPGMRELALWAEDADLSESFADVKAVLGGCRFVDCQHEGQPGCAVDAALDSGALDPARLDSYFKLQREIAHNQKRGSWAVRRQQKLQGKSRVKHQRALRRTPFGGKQP